MIRVEETPLPGVRVVHTTVLSDARGSFRELWHARSYEEAGIGTRFVQDNVSISGRGVLRGLHFQHPNGQAKLVSVLDGEIWDVAVDVRRGSPTYAQWFGVTLTQESGNQLYIPDGYAHGFVVTSERAVVSYKCSSHYDPAAERSVRWDDPAIGIDWPIGDPVLSGKDRSAPNLAAVERLPEWATTS